MLSSELRFRKNPGRLVLGRKITPAESNRSFSGAKLGAGGASTISCILRQ